MLTRGIHNPTPGAPVPKPVSAAGSPASAKNPTQTSNHDDKLSLLASASEYVSDPLKELNRQFDISWVADAAPDGLFDDLS